MAPPMQAVTPKPVVNVLPPDATLFESDDWVFVRRRLASVVRIGFGDYAQEARVLDPTEPMN
eukprot:15466307-Alexandrium_andersonii.AAC.1